MRTTVLTVGLDWDFVILRENEGEGRRGLGDVVQCVRAAYRLHRATVFVTFLGAGTEYQTEII